MLARGYPGGTDLSGGQWQRVALARALCAVRRGAGLVLLDEPTAQLDVRGEAEIFERILAATRHATTILISHRFSTVRHADRICVLERGRVVELGTHDELMAAGGRYRTMFELQASRFGGEGEEGEALDVLYLTSCPPALSSMWRALRRGYQAEPLPAVVSFGLALLAALPDALLALWLKLLADGVLDGRRGLVLAAAFGPRRLGRRHLVPRAWSATADAAPLPRPGDHRARVARGAGSRRRSRRSSTTSAPSTSTGSRCSATRCSCSTTCTCRCSRPAAGSCGSGVTLALLVSIHPALGAARRCSRCRPC